MNATTAELERAVRWNRGAAAFERAAAQLELDPQRAAQRRHLADVFDGNADYAASRLERCPVCELRGGHMDDCRG